MRKGVEVVIALAMALGTMSCSKNGQREVLAAMHTMEDLKTFRATSTSGSVSLTTEYVCPDRRHVTGKDEGGNPMEGIFIGGKVFSRIGPDESWVQEPGQSGLGRGTVCQWAVMEATGGQFGFMASLATGRPKEPKYMGREAIGGETCESWAIPWETFGGHHPGQYEPPEQTAAVVCIDRNHRILQTKSDNKILRFYDFNQDITINEPVISAAPQTNP